MVSAAPLPVARQPEERLTVSRPRGIPSFAELRRRRSAITWTKRLLPLGALGLLAAVALWPELDRNTEKERVTLHALSSAGVGGTVLTDPHYRSVDVRGRPYTVTALRADQVGGDRVNLADPKADATLENGNWVMVQARRGVFLQRAGQLDLSGDATLYRADGTSLVSDTSAVDVKAGAAASHDLTHAEGPFGTLDAMGFTLLDKGALIQFAGPSHARLNGAQAEPPAPQPPARALAAAPPRPPVLTRHAR